jgi:hypothetical protein
VDEIRLVFPSLWLKNVMHLAEIQRSIQFQSEAKTLCGLKSNLRLEPFSKSPFDWSECQECKKAAEAIKAQRGLADSR